jgi:2-polyprenyl-3-methyl-5-hydroxy-6-metoxy-1,4-benzoquinol methylase
MSKEIKQTKSYYDKHATAWSKSHSNSFHHEMQFTKFAALLKKGSTVLDIGCAQGIHVPLFHGIGAHLKYIGIDISTSFIKIAKRRYPQLTFLEGDIADEKTLPKKKFDAFIATAVLMHVPHELWNQMYSNIEKLTKRGALGYVVLPTEHPSATKSETDTRHFTTFTAQEQQRFIKERGWKILHSGTLDGTTKTGIWKWYVVQLP